MVSKVRIKRSSVAGNPSTLGAGELAYSSLPDNGSNGGDRLYIGVGVETAGNAANHVVIGGAYFTDMLDHTKGVLTPNSSIITDTNSKIDNLKVDNVNIDGNTINVTDLNGDLNLSPNGTGKVVITNPYVGSASLAQYIKDTAGAQITDTSEIDATYTSGTGDITLDLKPTTVASGTYGSATQIPTFTVDTKGRLTSAGVVSISTTLNVVGDSGVDAIALATDTLNITGSNSISTAVNSATNTLVISAADATTTTKGVASFNTDTFSVTAGAVSVKPAGISNTQLQNPSFTIGSTSVELGATNSSIENLALTGTPTAPTAAQGVSSNQIATTSFVATAVDAARVGLDVKASVKVASTANITLSGTQTIDGVSLAAGDRVLVKNQTNASQNGIYVVNVSTWARSTDANSSETLTPGAFVYVEEGGTNQSSNWVLTTKSPITINATNLQFEQFSGTGQITAGGGLTKTGNTINAVAGTGIVVNPDDIALTGQALEFHNLSTNGLVTRTATGVVTSRTITGVLDRVSIANGDGVSANPVIDIASTYAGQTSLNTLGTVTTGTWNASTVAAGFGGTGFSSYNAGDILFAGSATSLSKLNIGTEGKILQVSASGQPSWGDIDGGVY